MRGDVSNVLPLDVAAMEEVRGEVDCPHSNQICFKSSLLYIYVEVAGSILNHAMLTAGCVI